MKRFLLTGLLFSAGISSAQTQADFRAMDAVTPSAACTTALKEKGYEWRGGVVYTSNELSRKWHGLPFTEAATTAPLFAAVRDELTRQGKTLVLIPMAPRQLYADRPGTFGPTASSDLEGYKAFITALRGQGIKVVDPTTILTNFDADFFRQETHWRSEGAEKIAKEVAKAAGSVFKSPAATYATRKAETISYSRDAALYKIVRDNCGYDLPAEQLNKYVSYETSARDAFDYGFSSYEKGHRWGLNTPAGITYFSPKAEKGTLNYTWFSPIKGQYFTVNLNGKQVLDTRNAKSASNQVVDLPFTAGENRIEFTFGKWNAGADAFAPAEVRKLSVDFKELTVKSGDFSYSMITSSSNKNQDLLGSAQVPVVNIGSSFSKQGYFGFTEFLRASLKHDVANISTSGGWTFSSMKDFLFTEAYEDLDPEVVTWEFPVYGGDEDPAGALRQVLGALARTCTPLKTQAAAYSTAALRASGVKSLRFSSEQSRAVQLKYTVGDRAFLLQNAPQMANRTTFFVPVLQGDADALTIDRPQDYTVSACK